MLSIVKNCKNRCVGDDDHPIPLNFLFLPPSSNHPFPSRLGSDSPPPTAPSVSSLRPLRNIDLLQCRFLTGARRGQESFITFRTSITRYKSYSLILVTKVDSFPVQRGKRYCNNKSTHYK
ncbi:hypothetical protein E2C01_044809 [Portunus trituberculatus]|uniref:Uncharacterized protein n=1 Tax=Portunus trituberculatus TaxID=210409 RepID=A0A5B7G3C9_PORTR|nr:hypothetical protein [Portunus trituberculatus]